MGLKSNSYDLPLHLPGEGAADSHKFTMGDVIVNAGAFMRRVFGTLFGMVAENDQSILSLTIGENIRIGLTKGATGEYNAVRSRVSRGIFYRR